MSRLIRVHNNTYNYLKSMGRKGETFDDVIIRLLFIDDRLLEDKKTRRLNDEREDDSDN